MVSSPRVAAPPTSLARDALMIARFDLRESIRTRRALVLALLYLLTSAIISYVYVKAVVLVEETASDAIGMMPDAGDRMAAGAAVGLAQNEAYQGALYVLAGGDAQISAHLATYPPMVLVFGWFSLAFLPWLIALTCYDLIAGDIHLRTIRFVALRTSRGAFVVGKLLSQVLLITAIAILSTLPVLAFGVVYVKGFDVLGNLVALVQMWPILVLFSLAVLGPITFASQLVRTPGAARALAILLLFALWILSTWAVFAGPPFSLLGMLTPYDYKTGFFDPDLTDRLLTAAGCLAICAGYTWLGFLRFRRRDL